MDHFTTNLGGSRPGELFLNSNFKCPYGRSVSPLTGCWSGGEWSAGCSVISPVTRIINNNSTESRHHPGAFKAFLQRFRKTYFCLLNNSSRCEHVFVFPTFCVEKSISRPPPRVRRPHRWNTVRFDGIFCFVKISNLDLGYLVHGHSKNEYKVME